MTKAVIFDMDGTLFQTDHILELSLDDTFEFLKAQGKWNGETPIGQYRNIMGVPLPKVWKTLLPDFTIQKRDQVDAYFQERLIENIKRGNGALYPNVEEIFNELTDQNYKIFIASNGLTRYLQAITEYYQLNSWVSEVFSIEQIKSLNKSDLVQSIVQKYGITKGALVGDRLSDFQAANDNGLMSIGCRFDFAREDELSKAEYVIDDLAEIKYIEV